MGWKVERLAANCRQPQSSQISLQWTTIELVEVGSELQSPNIRHIFAESVLQPLNIRRIKAKITTSSLDLSKKNLSHLGI